MANNEMNVLKVGNSEFEIADAQARQDVSDLKDGFSELAYSDSKYITTWEQGWIRTDGMNGVSSTDCRTDDYVQFTSTEVSFEVLSGWKIYNIHEYDATKNPVAEVATNKTGSFTIEINAEHFYRFTIEKIPETSITPSDIPSNALKVNVREWTDKTLSVSEKIADAKVTGDKIGELQDEVAALGKVTALDTPYYYTPYIKFPMLSGVRTDFYYDNELYGAYKRMLGATCGQVGVSIHKDSVSFIPNDSTSFASVTTVYLTNPVAESNTENITKTIQIVKTTDGNNISKKCLLIGDSMTAQGKYQNFANQYFSNDGMSVEWLGTRESQFGLKHEGRSGWRAYTYTHFSQTTAADGEGEATTNAFWNPTTGQFDFNYYMAQQGYSGVDIVFINLGTNDLARANHSTTEEVLASWKAMIDSIHEYDSSIEIVLWLCPMPCIMLGVSGGVKRVYTMHKIIMDNYRGGAWGHDNIWILPSFLTLDPVYGFPMREVARNEYDATLITEPSDTAHPSDSGYHQLANPIIAMIKYLGSLS